MIGTPRKEITSGQRELDKPGLLYIRTNCEFLPAKVLRQLAGRYEILTGGLTDVQLICYTILHTPSMRPASTDSHIQFGAKYIGVAEVAKTSGARAARDVLSARVASDKYTPPLGHKQQYNSDNVT
jgi:hypothetical protein